MEAEIERWRKYLRRDPTRFLLDADANPSVYLWYLIDIAHRPEDSLAVHEARERVLYSAPVQEILGVQQAEGFWPPADSLAEPRYRATLWNLALLAELGIPHDSRRARAGCEVALQSFMNEQGRFSGLDTAEAGLLIRAMAYFGYASEERVRRAARALVKLCEEEDTDQARLSVIWAWDAFSSDPDIASAKARITQRMLNSAAFWSDSVPITFPMFDTRDGLFVLRVFGEGGWAGDPRLARLVESLIAKQNEQGEWPVEKSLNGSLVTQLEPETHASRWATLNALRVILKLIGTEP